MKYAYKFVYDNGKEKGTIAVCYDTMTMNFLKNLYEDTYKDSENFILTLQHNRKKQIIVNTRTIK